MLLFDDTVAAADPFADIDAIVVVAEGGVEDVNLLIEKLLLLMYRDEGEAGLEEEDAATGAILCGTATDDGTKEIGGNGPEAIGDR